MHHNPLASSNLKANPHQRKPVLHFILLPQMPIWLASMARLASIGVFATAYSVRISLSKVSKRFLFSKPSKCSIDTKDDWMVENVRNAVNHRIVRSPYTNCSRSESFMRGSRWEQQQRHRQEETLVIGRVTFKNIKIERNTKDCRSLAEENNESVYYDKDIIITVPAYCFGPA